MTSMITEQAIGVKCEDDNEGLISIRVGDKAISTSVSIDLCDEILVPAIYQEINTGHSFAAFRVLYNCMVMATWYKLKYAEHHEVSEWLDTRKLDRLQATNTVDPHLRTELDAELVERYHECNGTFMGLLSKGEADIPSAKKVCEAMIEASAYNKAYDALKELSHFAALKLGQDHELTAQINYSLAASMSNLQLHNDAIRVLQDVQHMYCRLFGVESEQTREIVQLLIAELKVLGRELEAAKLAEAMEEYWDEPKLADSLYFFNKYMVLYNQGVFYLARHEFDNQRNVKVARSYFAGEIDFSGLAPKLEVNKWG